VYCWILKLCGVCPNTTGIYVRRSTQFYMGQAPKSARRWKQFNLLTPNVNYSWRTAPLTSKFCILYIYSTDICTEYFKHGIYCPFFLPSKCSLFHNSNVFGSCIIHILYTVCAKIKKNNSGAKRLRYSWTEVHISRTYYWAVHLIILVQSTVFSLLRGGGGTTPCKTYSATSDSFVLKRLKLTHKHKLY